MNDKALLVKLGVSQWTNEKEDQTVSHETCDRHSAQRDTGRFVKHICPPRVLEPIRKSVVRLYTQHRTLTLPWLNDGSRILKASAYTQYMDVINVETAVFNAAKDTFINQYDGLRDEARSSQGSLYSDRDWPSKETVGKKFGVSVRNFPLPSSNDFRQEIFNHIPPEDRDRIIQSAKDDERALTQQCIADVFSRMRLVVGNLAGKLEGYQENDGGKTRMQESIVGNIRNLVDLLPALNVTDDPMIAEMGQFMIDKLANYDVDTLKNSGLARDNVRAQADEFFKKLQAYGV